jgi:threonine dehydrogenase-like Zn-dependent dehydrogenase
MAESCGLSAVYPAVPLQAEGLRGSVALVVECSGHEEAALHGAQVVRKRGEVVLVGGHWEQRTDISAHELLDVVFHNYAVLRSGWEWELPRHASDFRPHSIYGGFRLALSWLAEGRIPLHGLIGLHSPEDAEDVYQALLHGTAGGLFQVFDWPRLGRAGERAADGPG